MLLTPFNGDHGQRQDADRAPWIDVIFMPGGAGTKVIGVNGNEMRIPVPAPRTSRSIRPTRTSGVGTATEVAPNTWRYSCRRRNARPAAVRQRPGDGRVPGDLDADQAPRPTWCVVTAGEHGDQLRRDRDQPGRDDGDVHGRLDDDHHRAAPTATALGPLTLDGFTIGLAGTAFKDGKLVLTIGIGANEATLAFGGSGRRRQPDQQRHQREADRHPGHVRRRRRHRQGGRRDQQPGRAARRVRA